MKTITAVVLCMLLLNTLTTFPKNPGIVDELRGAWEHNGVDGKHLMIIEDDYCSITAYDPGKKQFYFTKGGVVGAKEGTFSLRLEFHSKQPEQVGNEIAGSYRLAGERLSLQLDKQQYEFTRIDKNRTPLTGCWRINGRGNKGSINEMKLGPRKTLKLLSGTKFQWIAINTETKEFHASGGGSYTFKDGKYTEHIEFFSRDSSRVGASLTFDGKVENDMWFHSGLSSKGNPVNERWINHFNERKKQR